MKLHDEGTFRRTLIALLLVAALLAVLAALLFPVFARAREKARRISGHANVTMVPPPPDAAYEAAEAPVRPDRDAWMSSTYMGGEGARERLAKLIDEGVIAGGEMVKLEAFTREYAQSFEAPTDRALALSALTERSKIVRLGGETYLQVGLQAIDREAPRRPPLNVCLVIDRSGSMGDAGKLEYARQAAAQVLTSLADGDTVAVVAYDDRVEVLARAQKAAGRNSIIRMIEGLGPGGSTNIYAGLEAGYRELRKNLSSDTLNKLILLSDGQVTAGVADPNEFARLTAASFDEDDIETTSIGMGLDYDEELMMTIAREGKGNYHFIREAEAIGDILHDELEQLTQIVAKAVRLRIELADDVELLSILGSRELEEEEVAAVKRTERVQDERIRRELGITRDREDIEDEPGIKMMIPQFAMGTSHVVMLQIKVPPGGGERAVADVHLKYKDIIFAQNQEQTETATIEYTGSQDASFASIRRPVKKNELGFRTGEALKAAAALLQRGEYGKAAEVIDEQMALLGVAAQEWNDRDLDRDGELLAAYRQVIGDAGTQIASNPELGDYLVKSLTYSAYQRTH